MNEPTYDLEQLANLKPVDSRYFACRQCGFPNLVGVKDLRDILTEPKKSKSQIHFECEWQLGIQLKKLKANFGSYENMFLHLVNSFYKSQPSENQSVEPNEIRSQQDSQFVQQVPAGASDGNDAPDGTSHGEVHTSSQGQD